MWATGTSATPAGLIDSTHMKHFEPTKGVGLLRLLQRAGYTVLLVAESYTSKRCYACEAGEVHTFRTVRCRVCMGARLW